MFYKLSVWVIYLDLIEKSSEKADLRSFGVPLIQVLRLWYTIVFKDYKTVNIDERTFAKGTCYYHKSY